MKELFTPEAIRFWNHYQDLDDLPVLAFYSDSFPHEKVTIGKKIQDLLNSEFGISQSAGYYNWDDPRDCGLVWQQYFAMQWKNDKYGHTSNNEADYIQAVGDSMKQFAASLPDAEKNEDFELREITVMSRGEKDVVVLRFANGMESDFETLPAGYRRAFSIAFDLANRAFLLNNNCNPNGVCFIDEIDLHLHPSLAQEILERLRTAFPRIQFIASTHSPVVLTNFKQDENNYVYRLNRDSNSTYSIQKIDYSYGIDYNSLLTDLMGTAVRNSVLRKYIDDYRYWTSSGEDELAQSTMKMIIRLVGPNSELVQTLQAR